MVGQTKYDSLFYTPPWIRNNAQLRDHVLNLFPGAPDKVMDEIKTKYPIQEGSMVTEMLLKAASLIDVSQTINAQMELC